MPEIMPSPGTASDFFGRNIDRCWTCRSMFMQAWGNYGTAWPVIHQQLGVRPDLGRGRLEVVPQVPDGQTLVEAKAIRLGLGGGSVRVRATHRGSVYTTIVDARGSTPVRHLRVGVTLPRGGAPTSVTLDGRQARFKARLTNRGVEVTVTARRLRRHTLVVTTA
jgi:hypothetical protein